MSLDALTRLLPIPEKPIETGTDQNWESVENQIGTKLPTDYKDFVNRYGTGRIGNFIWIFNPFSKNANLQLHEQLKRVHQTDQELKATFGPVMPVPVFPDHDGVLPFGLTDNGDYLSWLVGNSPDVWPVIVSDSRGPEWERFNLSMTEFLAAILSKSRFCGIFPDDFPPRILTFVPRG